MPSPIFVPTRARVAALARRIAFRVLVADLTDTGHMDAWIRTKLLEAAAGLRYGTWSTNPTRGLPAAREHFPEADPDWFSPGEQGLFKSIAAGVNRSLRGYGSDDLDDVIMEVVGSDKYMTASGKKLADKRTGIDGLGTARSYMSTIAKSRASDWRKRRQKWEGGAEAEHERERHEQPWKALKPQQLSLVELAGDRLMADRKLMTMFKRTLSSMSGSDKDIMEAWVRHPNKDNKDIGNDLGLSPSNPSAPVGQAKLKAFKKFFSDSRIVQYLELRAEMANAENAQYSSPKRAPSGDPGGSGLGDMKWAKSIKRLTAAFLASQT